MRAGRILASLFVLASIAGFGLPQAGAAEAKPPAIGRWLGAESGFTETACYGFAAGCPGFLSIATFGGSAATRETHKPHQDLDMVNRVWPARTGNYLYMASVPGGTPAVAYLSTLGSDYGPVKPGTVTFGIRVHNLPVQPVVIYRHSGSIPAETPLVTVTLSPDGRLLLSAAGSVIGATQPLITQAWHELTVTYAPQSPSVLKLYADDQPPVVGTLALPAPSGDVDIGIVSPSSTPFTMGLDDFVESPSFDAPIRGARVNYLMPLGETAAAWEKSYPIQACRDIAKNWQMVSEDQHVTGTTSDGKPISCNLGGSAVLTEQNNAVDSYVTEGVPSRHSPTAKYNRDLGLQAKPGDMILGVRLRARGLTDGPPVPIPVTYLDQGVAQKDTLTFDGGGTGGSQMRWGPTHPTRPSGAAWTSSSLGGLELRLDSGPGLPSLTVRRHIFVLRLDYVWVP